jgi:apolipoprotein D and lipocalin family protein
MKTAHRNLRNLCGRACALLACALALAACANRNAAPLPTVASVDVPGYMGAWYEIAMLPNRFQAQCVADTQARYRVDGDQIRVTNRCRNAKGEVETANGVAHAVDGSNNAKLRVSFFRPFYGNYWVLAFGPGNQWVLIGEPGREYSWVLARTPKIEEAALNAALDRATALGFDRAAYRKTPQTQPLD